MIQVQERKYDNGMLLSVNRNYGSRHTFTEEDVEKVNSMVSLIESTRSQTTPKTGDRILYTDRYGNYYPRAIIQKYRDGELLVCKEPIHPFIVPASGGIWCYKCDDRGFIDIQPDKVSYAGTNENIFRVWDHKGPNGRNDISFSANVSLWKYADANPLYGHFTTEKWRKLIFLKTDHPRADGYMYRTKYLSFPDEQSFQHFLNSFCGTVFPGQQKNEYVVWCYDDIVKSIPVNEWESLKYPVSFRLINGIRTEIKIQKDLKNHIVYTLYIDKN